MCMVQIPRVCKEVSLSPHVKRNGEKSNASVFILTARPGGKNLFVAIQTKLAEISFWTSRVFVYEANEHTLITYKLDERFEASSGAHH